MLASAATSLGVAAFNWNPNSRKNNREAKNRRRNLPPTILEMTCESETTAQDSSAQPEDQAITSSDSPATELRASKRFSPSTTNTTTDDDDDTTSRSPPETARCTCQMQQMEVEEPQPPPAPAPPYEEVVATSEQGLEQTPEVALSSTREDDPVPVTTTTTPGPEPETVPEVVTSNASVIVGDGGNLGLETEEQRQRRIGLWPHSPCSLFACISCTLGMFTICRFSFLCLQYGGGFVLQFLMLTVLFGLPMVSFHMSAGQYLGMGAMDMWKVSPIFQGVGIASLFGTAIVGIYSVVPVSWMFVYFRDAFVTNVTFKWGECRSPVRQEDCTRMNASALEMFRRAVPSYFHQRVLQRRSFTGAAASQSSELVFENVFNLAVVWMIVFISLSKGIKSYGKVVLAFGVFPMVSFVLVAIELLRRAGPGAGWMMTLNTDFNSFFVNSWSWLAAAREVFFIWGINGAVIMQMTSHNKPSHSVKRDCIILIVATLAIVLVSAFLSCACLYIIYSVDHYKTRFVPSSYENDKDMVFMMPLGQSLQTDYGSLSEYRSVDYLLGTETTNPRADPSMASGYQIARLATELFPMAVVSLGPGKISAFWPVLFYLCLITFGIAQQLAIWKCVVEGIIAVKPDRLRPWETTVTFVACVFGFVLGLPFTTQVGVFVVHFMDVCVGCAWWLMAVYLTEAFALFLVRGCPYGSDEIISVFTITAFARKWVFPIMTFSWNIVLPITLMVLCVVSFKLGEFGKMFNWTENSGGYIHWPVWAKQLGSLVQIAPVIIIPIMCLVQTVRYLSKGNRPMSVRLQMLYRPTVNLNQPSGSHRGSTVTSPPANEPNGPQSDSGNTDDPPPKYTPPPSYGTATGLKVLKRLNTLRMSIRRFAADAAARRRSQLESRNADVELRAAEDLASTSTSVASSLDSQAEDSNAPPSYAAATVVVT